MHQQSIEISERPARALLLKYGVDSAGYALYPPLHVLDEQVGEAHYMSAARSSNDNLIPAPLSLNLRSAESQGQPDRADLSPGVFDAGHDYLRALLSEVRLQGGFFDADRCVEQLQIDATNRTILNAAGREVLMTALGDAFSLIDRPSRDYAIRIDHRHLLHHEIGQLVDLGFNRISLEYGLDTAPESRRQFGAIVDAARQQDIETVSTTLVYGMPGQTPAACEVVLNDVLALMPDSLALVDHVEALRRLPPGEFIRAEKTPDLELRLSLLERSFQQVVSAGYRHLGLYRFARPGSTLDRAARRGELHCGCYRYLSHGYCDEVGLGAGALSHLGDAYFQTERSPRRYCREIATGRVPIARGRVATTDDLLRADVIRALLCTGSVSVGRIERDFAIDFDAYFRAELDCLRDARADGLVAREHGEIRVTASGRAFVAAIARCFDAYRQGVAILARTPVPGN